MSNVSDNLILSGASGKIDNDHVLKLINGKTFLCKMPDMSSIEPSPAQIAVRQNFGARSRKAKELANNPESQQTFCVPADQSLYRAIFKEELKEPIPEPVRQPIQAFVKKKRPALNPRQQAALHLLRKYNTITNAAYQQLNNVSKATATRDLQQMVAQNYLVVSGKKGPAVYYTLPQPVVPAT